MVRSPGLGLRERSCVFSVLEAGLGPKPANLELGRSMQARQEPESLPEAGATKKELDFGYYWLVASRVAYSHLSLVTSSHHLSPDQRPDISDFCEMLLTTAPRLEHSHSTSATALR